MPQPTSCLARRVSMDRSSSSSVSVTVDDTDPRDPTAQCDRCGRRGTVARAVRHSEPPLILRYCSSCWPAAQEELEARQRDELKQWKQVQKAAAARERSTREALVSSSPPAAWSSSSRSWHDASRFLALIAQQAKGSRAPTSTDLAAIAKDIRAKSAEMDGPIPPDIQDFLDRYSPPAA
jgi:hypothetical protein